MPSCTSGGKYSAVWYEFSTAHRHVASPGIAREGHRRATRPVAPMDDGAVPNHRPAKQFHRGILLIHRQPRRQSLMGRGRQGAALRQVGQHVEAVEVDLPGAPRQASGFAGGS
jgi:hypothetical protein